MVQSYAQQTVAEPLVIPTFAESNTFEPREVPDQGFYTFELLDIGDPVKMEAQYDPTGLKRRAKFTFKVVGGDWDGTEVDMLYNLTMNEKGFLYPVVKALMGGELDPHMRPNRETLVGHRMQATLDHVVKRKDDGTEVVYPTIKSPMPIRASSRKKKAETLTIAEDEVPF